MLNKTVPFILIICCLLLFSNCTTPIKKIDCSKFKTGTFLFRYRTLNETINFLLIRNKTSQTEINKTTGDSSTYRIRWINECSYELKFLSGTEILADSLLRLRKSTTITTTIVEANNDYCRFKVKSDKSDYTLEDTMWIQK